MKKQLLVVSLVVVAAGAIIWGINRHATTPSATQGGKLQVTTSFYPLYFFASQIAGDKATIYNITPSGAEPHDYDPSTQDVARIEDSQLLILNGGKLEAWGDKIKETLQGTQTKVITAGDELTNQQVDENGRVIQDPHVWLDPKLAKQEAAAIEQGLEAVDPSNAGTYQANAVALEGKLDQLDQEYATGLSNCQKKDIITAHAAFGYLATDYHLTQVPISGLSPDEEPSPQKLAEISDFAKKNNIQYIFFESLVSPKLSETIANEVGAKTMVLDPIEGLSEQQLAAGTTYLTEMKQNLANLQIALECR